MDNIREWSLFAWGANSHGQLAIGKESEMEVLPVEVDTSSLEDVPKQISGGGGHILILDVRGQVYSCGWNSRGQLGTGDFENRSKITKIPQEAFQNEEIKAVASGWDTSAAVTEDGQLFMWGSNQFGQFLGRNLKELTQAETPQKISLRERVKEVVFGLRHVCIITEGGTLYVSGKSKCIPGGFLEISGENIYQIATGQHHFVYQSLSGLHTRGDNTFGQLSDDSLKSFASETLCLKSGWTHSGLLTTSRRVFLWGRNSYGQIGRKPTKSIHSPTEFDVQEEIEALHLGSEHGLCLTVAGEVLTWGWNEHGNCGNGNTNDVYKPQKVVLPGKCSLAGVGAGFCYCVVNRPTI